jgi:hypothetical protein
MWRGTMLGRLMPRMFVWAQRPGAKEAIEHEGFFSNKMLVSEYLQRMRVIVSSWALFADV